MTQREFTEQNEGKFSKPYKCTAGKKTIGIGHNMEANPLPKDIRDYLKRNGRITNEHIDRLFEIDIQQAISDCKKLFPGYCKFSENRKIALTDFVFQLGITRAGSFIHAITAINTGRWNDAVREMLDSAWAWQTPNRAKRVTDLILQG